MLTTRDPEAWYASLKNHHFTQMGLAPTASSSDVSSALRADDYVAPAWRYENHCRQFGIEREEQLYDREHYLRNLEQHNAAVRDLIPPGQLLELDLSRHGGPLRLPRYPSRPGAPHGLGEPAPVSRSLAGAGGEHVPRERLGSVYQDSGGRPTCIPWNRLLDSA